MIARKWQGDRGATTPKYRRNSKPISFFLPESLVLFLTRNGTVYRQMIPMAPIDDPPIQFVKYWSNIRHDGSIRFPYPCKKLVLDRITTPRDPRV